MPAAAREHSAAPSPLVPRRVSSLEPRDGRAPTAERRARDEDAETFAVKEDRVKTDTAKQAGAGHRRRISTKKANGAAAADATYMR